MATNLSHFTDMHMRMQKVRVAANNRKKHLEKRGVRDERIEEIYQQSVNLEETLERYIADEFEHHPAYPWLSRIMGCGKEAAAKPVGKIEGVIFRGALLEDLNKVRKAAGADLVDVDDLKENWVDLETAYPDIFKRRSSIYAFDTMSKLRTFCGLRPVEGHTEKIVKGQKGLHYNPELRMLLWRLLTRLMQQVDYVCPDCGKSIPKEDEKNEKTWKCKHCRADIRGRQVKVTGVWYKKYIENMEFYENRAQRDGVKVIPTPAGRFCFACGEEKKIPKTTLNCPECGEKLGTKVEPPGVLFQGHVVAMAKRRTIRLFVDCLYLVWREAVGMPYRGPYIVEYGGHHLIDPWKMVDRDGVSS